MSELKAGDAVWLKCTVEKVYGDGFVIAESWFHVGEEEHVSPAPAGDAVRERIRSAVDAYVVSGRSDVETITDAVLAALSPEPEGETT